jgi:hypothetical protein
MMSSMTTSPPTDTTLYGARATESEEILEWKGGIVGSMSPKTMITGGDAETGEIVVEDRPGQG